MASRLSLFFCVGLSLGLIACNGGQGALSLEVICGLPDGPVVDVDVVVLDYGLPEDLPNRDTSDAGDESLPDFVVTDAPDTPIVPGEFGSYCQGNSNCFSGFCIEGAEGFVCTQQCVSDCPEGWICRTYVVGQDVQSLCSPVGANLCKACKNDLQCGDGVCLTLAEGQFCGRDCKNGPCPTGYECSDVPLGEGGVGRQCKPLNRTCSCRVTSEGQERPCIRENLLGRCLGFETCAPAQGWVGCSALEPSLEICNGIDDDCNLVTDDNPEPPTETCANQIPGVGSCPGTNVCRGEIGWTCVGPLPVVETCNYLDDNCDGLTDETFKDDTGRYSSYDNCGQCGVSCAGRVPFAKTVICDRTKATPGCAVVECERGYLKVNDLVCAPEISSLCVPCTEDANCGSAGADKCLAMGGTMKFCGRDCGPGAAMGGDCPVGYRCQDFGSNILQCIPVSGTCECTAANAGIVRLCQVTTPAGTCSGTETCDSSQGLSLIHI